MSLCKGCNFCFAFFDYCILCQVNNQIDGFGRPRPLPKELAEDSKIKVGLRENERSHLWNTSTPQQSKP